MSYGDPFSNQNQFPPNPYQPPGTPGYMPSPQPSPPVLPIVSLVCGVLGLVTTCCCGLFGLPIPLVAIVTGGIALAQPNAGGKGMAIAGVALGAVCFLLGIGLFVLVLANPDFMRQIQQMKQLK